LRWACILVSRLRRSASGAPVYSAKHEPGFNQVKTRLKRWAESQGRDLHGFPYVDARGRIGRLEGGCW
jgi:hypothetical protein